MEEYTMHIDKGALHTIRMYYIDCNGDTVDLTLFTPKFRLITQNNITIFEKQLAVLDGEINDKLTPTETDSFTLREYRYQIDLVRGSEVLRILKGDAKIHLK